MRVILIHTDDAFLVSCDYRQLAIGEAKLRTRDANMLRVFSEKEELIRILLCKGTKSVHQFKEKV